MKWKYLNRYSLPIFISTFILTGCPNPYALKVSDINYDEPQDRGVIQFTDPKLYKREALINERRNEIEFLNTLLEASEADSFTFEPEIIRELEIISAISAAVSVSVDPTAGINYQRDKETSELQQQISVLRLQMQLDQLERDAVLLKDQLNKQEQLSTSVTPPNATVPSVSSSVVPPGTTSTLAENEKSRAALKAQLDKTFPALKKTSAAVNPSDRFMDISAYRALIKSAINTANLDELHEKDGASLFRLQFSATVLPPKKEYTDTLGILRMEIEPPELKAEEINNIYSMWLAYINRNLNRPPDPTAKLEAQRFYANARLVTLGMTGDLFRLITISVPKQTGKEGENCSGIDNNLIDTINCWYLKIASPIPGRPAETGDAAPLAEDFDTMLQLMSERPDALAAMMNSATGGLTKEIRAGRSVALTKDCRSFAQEKLDDKPLFSKDGDRYTLKAKQALAVASAAKAWWPYVTNSVGYIGEADYADRYIKQTISTFIGSTLSDGWSAKQAADRFLDSVRLHNPNCSNAFLDLYKFSAPPVFVKVIDVIKKDYSRIGIYDVEPKERAQQLSTAARAADAVSLAAAIAGKLPTYGTGASGDFAYTRSAIGKADARERAPLVIAFAEPEYYKPKIIPAENKTIKPETKPEVPEPTNARGELPALENPAFGWLLGPKVSLDAKQKKLVLQHHAAPYNLSADVTMPGWWPYFTLKAYSAWAPNWRTGNGYTLSSDKNMSLLRIINVPMERNSGDMAGFTNLILKVLVRQEAKYPVIADIEPRFVSACDSEVTFQIWGENIWRATQITIGGKLIGGADVSVLPDMSGVLAKVNLTQVPVLRGQSAKLTVLTKDGSATERIEFVDVRKADNDCQTPSAPAPVPKGPVITSVAPATISICDPSPSFTVNGKNLSTIKSASLGTINANKPVPLTRKHPGTALTISVTSKLIEKKFRGLSTTPLILRSDTGVVSTADITISNVTCK